MTASHRSLTPQDITEIRRADLLEAIGDRPRGRQSFLRVRLCTERGNAVHRNGGYRPPGDPVVGIWILIVKRPYARWSTVTSIRPVPSGDRLVSTTVHAPTTNGVEILTLDDLASEVVRLVTALEFPAAA